MQTIPSPAKFITFDRKKLAAPIIKARSGKLGECFIVFSFGQKAAGKSKLGAIPIIPAPDRKPREAPKAAEGEQPAKSSLAASRFINQSGSSWESRTQTLRRQTRVL